MRNKASLSLMEQLVMILVFSLAAALCLGAFSRAQSISQMTSRRETGAQIAQNGAEWLKAGKDLETMTLPEGYDARFVPGQTEVPGLCTGTLEVWHEAEKEIVFSLNVGWQEAMP